MKPLIALFGTVVLFTGCLKKDIVIINGKLAKCDIPSQSGVPAGITHGGGFKKTYYSSGLVRTVSTVIYLFSDHFDSIDYKFVYSGNTARVTASKRAFLLFSDPFGSTDPFNPPQHYEFTVKFDPQTGFATSAGNTTFMYQNGRFTGYNDGSNEFISVFDNKGNILRPNGPFGHPLPGVIYEYDYTKTAKEQLYYTSGYQTNEMYNLMEILDWIPVQPKNLRISHTAIFGGADETGEAQLERFTYNNHKVNADGLLISFSGKGLTTVNSFRCQPIIKTIK